ncbi:SDR family NAD(P)-dependent oxidoreductase [Streptomyces sp. HNM0575]|uniref:type I polyketide synthase n=1 Tax=Streptomyces sp. HNM0575 TaxID=2716338 RepID=UPI00145E1E02|nr:type I polyketide synthase [Streptomyces sp. HNM0575]NLU73886.1 SDR family NAD(P)-dependent oxidoreductase [Streptomyces sp. HNM0575]
MRMLDTDASDVSSRSNPVIAINPLHRPSPRFTAAACAAGALGVLELPTGDTALREAAGHLERTERWSARPFGVRIRPGCAVTDGDLPPAAHTVLLADPARSPGEFGGRRVLVEATGLDEARRAAAAGAHGLIVRGAESGGRAGESSTFVLLQQVLADRGGEQPGALPAGIPVWACGGIGPHTAAAAVAGGAAGVVLDTQLALLDEAGLPLEITEALAGCDGSETVVHHGMRVLRRRGPGAPELPQDAGEFAARIGGGDLRRQFLPVGQDVFLAASFARRWPTVTDVVRGVREAVAAAVEDDEAATALGPGAPGAVALGTRLPVAQGPMTRVSDQAEFAAAVAADGALPFLALALAGPAQTRTMLEETRSALGEAPWGVGILGFADEEIRAAQLEVVRQIRPTHAIVAGGRPAQAAALEAEGISAFLHVPSPGLLRQFLAAGARKFVFEGAECGGHVGPRNSFPLWEAQAEILLEFTGKERPGVAGELTVLLAGGVHDERSASMVAALAAPLTRAGIATGVLMGTAYLFTEEAVEAGAILPGFQQQVVAAERTALLETAPGHATRCAHSAFTSDFASLKERLRQAGVPEREIWEQLEKFNVGRLRIASKGIERVGPELRGVDEQRQVDEGMFMAGEVCRLRRDVTTVAALHESVGERAAVRLRERARELRAELGLPQGGPGQEEEGAAEPLRVAIVGMAGMFPGAEDLSAFWANVLAGKDCVTEVPEDRWDAELYYAPDGEGERTPSRWGGFLPEIPFDPLSFGIPPASLASIEPVQLLALEAARRALADAGCEGRPVDHARTSVVFGAEAGSDLSNASVLRTVLPSYLGGELPDALDEQLPRLTEDSFPGVLANVIAGRIANRLNLGGANYTVDAACASSLTAVDVACKELVTGTSDMVLCGGADLHNGINDFLLFSSVHALSPTGRSSTFDGSADGIALGEGVGCVVLKRLEDAERDGDRVYAVIDGMGSASDGRALGLTAPRPEGQRSALTRAYRNAGVSPAQIGLIEAHGTGTVVGDRTELATLTEVFTEAGAAPGGCAVGSVKSQIGHTKCAAGLAGLIKATLALYHGVKPPTLHIEQPNAAWDQESSPFFFHSAARPWATEPAGRVAGVSAFGFGGTNFHAVLRAYDQAPPVHSSDEWPVELFTFRGKDGAAAQRAVRRLLEKLEQGGSTARAGQAAGRGDVWRLRDHARGAARVSDSAAVRGEPVRIALLARSTEELSVLLRRAADGVHDPAAGIYAAGGAGGTEPGEGAVAFLFPGQGSQRPGMLADLFVAFPELQHHLQLGRRWADALYPPTAYDKATADAQLARITDTAVAQPALGIVELAAADLLASLGIRPDMAAGHSYGELVALGVAGALSPRDVLTASAARAEAILGQIPDEGDAGAMAAVTAVPEKVDEVLALAGLDGEVVTANRNSPKQTVVSGPTDAVTKAVGRLRDAGLSARQLQVACAFHSPLVAGAGEEFARTLESMDVHAPGLPVWANSTAEPYGTDPHAVRAGLAGQIGSPVRFAEQIEAMYAAGARVFTEVGPGKVLTRLVSEILGDRPHSTVTLEDAGRGGLYGFLAGVAQLAVAGADVRTGKLYQGRDAVDPESTTPGKPAGWTVDGQLVRLADGTIPPNALRPPRPVTELIVPEPPTQDGAPLSGPDALIAEFLRTSREMVTAQRDVLLQYLGAAGLPPAPGADSPAPSALPVTPTLPAAASAATPANTGAAAPSTAAAPPTAAASAPAAASAAASASASGPAVLSADAVLESVLSVVAERTGYPVEMIEPGLDLEADLSVDSIKRAEIAGELAVRLGLPVGSDVDVEELSSARTAAGIAELLVARVGSTAATTTAPPPTAAASASASGPAVLSADAVLESVLSVVAERTGYPVEMIEPGLDLEADLSVDSIKRAEIAGELAVRLGLPVGSDVDVEELSSARTAAGITELLVARLGGGSSAQEQTDRTAQPPQTAPSPAPGASATAAPGAEPLADPLVVAPQRLEFTETELPAPPAPAIPEGTAVTVLGGGALGTLVAERLREAGALPQTVPEGQRLPEHIGEIVIHLHSLESPDTTLPETFPLFQGVLAAGPKRLLAADRRAQGAASGLRGFFRSVSREYEETAATLVEVGADDDPETVARVLVAELGATEGEPVVLAEGGRRRALRLTPTDLGAVAAAGAGPAGDGAAEAAAAGLDRDSVLLLVGGARGITARFARTVAAASRCRIELLGRTPAPPQAEDPATAAARGRDELRSAFIGSGMTSPAEIERAVSAVLAEREVRETLADLRESGSQARYHSVDALDEEAVRAVVKEVHAEHGRLDGVVYAAGVIEDKLIAEKSPESFRRVFATKADGARVLLDALGALPESPRFAVLFGSIAGALGNRGQADYAAANDALEELARRWSTEDRRGLTVHWGPWAPADGPATGGGMVTPELMRSYAARGIKLIDPEEGPLSLLRELAWGAPTVHAVVAAASGW